MRPLLFHVCLTSLLGSYIFAGCTPSMSTDDAAGAGDTGTSGDGAAAGDTAIPSDAAAPQMKLFFNAEITGKTPAETQINIRSASTTDGFHFTVDPTTWVTTNALSDPVVYRAKSGKWLIAGFHEGEGIRVAVHDQTPDFTNATFTIAVTKGQVPSLLEFDDGFRLYYFGDGGIQSAFSKDGVTWALEPGVRVGTPAGSNLFLIADPAPARRKDGTIVMYFKAATLPRDGGDSPYDHMIYRATSADGLVFTHENKLLVDHAGIPQAFTNAAGHVGVYFLDFAKFPTTKENIAAMYEQDDYSLTAPAAITFDKLPEKSWADDPTPILVP